MIDLTGKHIFIAGGSRGIGAASARMAASAGASVSINYQRDRAAADGVVADFEAAGGKALAASPKIMSGCRRRWRGCTSSSLPS